jgi:hypothetical protein
VTAPREASARRAARLLRWYPAAWRARYGDEFAELLIAEFAEQPRSWRRAADIARGGLLARLTRAGLAGHQPPSPEQVRAGLATAACALAAFGALGVAMWAQLATGWAWAPPAAAGPTIAMAAMSAAVLLLAVLGLLAAVPLAWSAARGLARRPARRALRGPALLAAAGTAVLAAGSHHFASAWPGSGAHPWAPHGLVPAGVAAFGWAATLSVSAYWAHPAALAAFPGAEIAWMAVSPAALAAAVTGVAGLVRRLDLSPRILSYEAWLASSAAAAMAVFLSGACCWVLAEGSGSGLFHAGAIDAGSLAVMSLALVMAHRATGLARKAASGDLADR